MTLRKTFGAGLTAAVIALTAIAGTSALLVTQRAAAADGGGAKEFSIDPVHSCVIFKIKHMNVGMFYGRFNDVGGTYTIDDADPSKSSLMVTIKTDSVDTNNTKRNDHLKSPDFFNAAQFPEITFKATKFEKAGTDTMNVTGDLTIKGVTKSVTAPITHVGSAEGRGGMKSGYETTFTVKRSDFGVSFMPQGLGEDVTVMFAFEGGAKG